MTDGVIGLRPLTVADTAAQLAGQDTELVRRLSGGWATEQRQREFLESAAGAWAEKSAVLDLGVVELSTGELAGTFGIQSGMPYLQDDQVNLTYGLYPQARGRGLATRAVLLWVRLAQDRWSVGELVIRIDPDNSPSARVAQRAGFRYGSHTDDSEGSLDWYVLRGAPSGSVRRRGSA